MGLESANEKCSKEVNGMTVRDQEIPKQDDGYVVQQPIEDTDDEKSTIFTSLAFSLLTPVGIVLGLAGIAAVTWYFLEYHAKSSELRIGQYYIGRLSVLNREFGPEYFNLESPTFKKEAGQIKTMIQQLFTSSSLGDFFNSTTVLSFGKGSLVPFFSLSLQVPISQQKKVNAQIITMFLQGVLSKNGTQKVAHVGRYDVDPQSVVFNETSAKEIDELEATLGCYRYNLIQPDEFIALKGPDSALSRCMWHLQAPKDHMIKLTVEWTLSDCRDRLAIYDDLLPLEKTLITLLYGCSRQEPVVQLLSTGGMLTIIWKQGEYSFYDPFLLAAQAVPFQACEADFILERQLAIQGSVSTPYFPSYYAPNTKCLWRFKLPSLEYGLALWFEGYELASMYFSQACTQGQWMIQNKRLCGMRILQPYVERIFTLSRIITITFASQISLTGPGVQFHFGLFNQSNPCPGEFFCSLNGLCVPPCDGIKDCPDGLDEANCVCPAKFRCKEDNTCIDFYQVCDTHMDCVNGTDESKCTEGIQCTASSYKCADGSCIKKPNPECDLTTDCHDMSDENNCDCGFQSASNRIIGGTDSLEGEWPWQASLQVQGYHHCGGALISDKWVVTAAHCFQDDSLASPSVWTVYLGKNKLNMTSKNEVSFKVKKIVVHQYYDYDNHDYDIALLQIERPVMKTPFVQPVCLPDSAHIFQPGIKCWVTGWGAVKEGGDNTNILQKADVQVISQDICNWSYQYKITPRMLCAGYAKGEKDACQGDSGGPLVCEEPSGRWFLGGLVSWGIGCARPYYYGVYTRMTKLVSWIHMVIS
ncbi:transmembrane protease serine 6 [Protopterus annectens]|uniref:transmembrane protease serine 6 n=1 Tax=Protopterus annectens TaxID=7888 RepID=UPI001CFA072B|nr:transmembrane protease serine 6 [Protopterus annectens]XP_043923955.1 transmembrane protease serine 6 [Protopterus annectens]XP_043923956.1 transmembrane protease serine 6 [Protopterus annectens]